jgi:hypothetical protein
MYRWSLLRASDAIIQQAKLTGKKWNFQLSLSVNILFCLTLVFLKHFPSDQIMCMV